MRIGRRLAAGGLLGHGALLEAGEVGLLRRLGAGGGGHPGSLARRLAHGVVAWARSFGWNDRVGLVHRVRVRRGGITDLTVLLLLLLLLLLLDGGHLLGIGELGAELGWAGHEGRGVHHGAGHCCGVGDVREAVVAIVVRDSGFVDPGAHDCRGQRATMVGPIWLISSKRDVSDHQKSGNDHRKRWESIH